MAGLDDEFGGEDGADFGFGDDFGESLEVCCCSNLDLSPPCSPCLACVCLLLMGSVKGMSGPPNVGPGKRGSMVVCVCMCVCVYVYVC